MKSQFSTQWNSSVQPRKQRKFRANAPLHVRGTFLHAHLAKDLRDKHKTRSLRLRVGDEVKIMRGQFAGRTGKVDRVDVRHTRVFVAGIESVKRDGAKKLYPLQPSNILIVKLTDDKRRLPGSEAPVKAKTPAVAKSATKSVAKPAPAAKTQATPAAKKPAPARAAKA